MKLVSRLRVSRFRSLKEFELDRLGNLTALAGLNNSGKSNVLRALNAFFTGDVEPGVPLEARRDFYRPEISSKKKKRIRVSVTFSLPKQFRFRTGLSKAKQLIGTAAEIAKEWVPGRREPSVFLNSSPKPLSPDDSLATEQFLSLIAFRYIPNRVLPLDVIRQEHAALRDALVRRFARKSSEHDKLFAEIEETSAGLIKKMGQHFVRLCSGVDSVRLKTPTSWAEILFSLGYQLSEGGIELEDSLQGSGIQSLLMFETLSLIDRDYFQQFGWRQAAIWAVEEPEASLHSRLEAQLAKYVAEIAADPKGRLQTIATTHSDLLLQYADAASFLKRDQYGTELVSFDKQETIRLSSAAGVSRWSHPLLCYPLEPLVLVEGKFDVDFLEPALRLLPQTGAIRVASLEALTGEDDGGVDRTLRYLKEHRLALGARSAAAPIIVVLDWDASKREASFRKAVEEAPGAQVMVWPESDCNPKLGKSFRGIERFMSDRLIRDAEKAGPPIARTKAGVASVERDEYGKMKVALNKAVRGGILPTDLGFAKPFLERLILAAKGSG